MSKEEAPNADEGEERDHQIGAGDYVAPVLNRKAFHCPHCGVYAPQEWEHLTLYGGTHPSHAWRGECFNCKKYTYWIAQLISEGLFEDHDAIMVSPLESTNAPGPHPDMPEKPRADYEEARAIVDRSPRGAAALLRLALQELGVALGEPGKNINDDIASLVQKGLDPLVQKGAGFTTGNRQQRCASRPNRSPRRPRHGDRVVWPLELHRRAAGLAAQASPSDL
jgi:hypothetical protein